ncbi:MAG: hypothetical protein CMJ46_00925 [Planctomyces sp.]|nr:hypothetical protein [Planctomyces sp.]
MGLTAGFASVCLGAKIRWRFPLEFYGGGITDYFQRIHARHGSLPMAMAFGHVILGYSEAALDITHDHEMVHVRQAERWGPLLIPAYLSCSIYLKLRGRDPYLDNPFEKEARRETERT